LDGTNHQNGKKSKNGKGIGLLATEQDSIIIRELNSNGEIYAVKIEYKPIIEEDHL
jgi:hypothetical protein